jgi:hypothetical protein
MTLSTKSLAKPVSEKKVKGSRKVKVELPLVEEEEVKEEEVKEEEVKEEEPVLEVLEVPSVTIEPGANACCESVLQEVSCPPCEEIEEPVEQIVLAKKCSKLRPQVDENGNYLNPLTNRYLKFGSSNFKKLLNAGIIKPRELDV